MGGGGGAVEVIIKKRTYSIELGQIKTRKKVCTETILSPRYHSHPPDQIDCQCMGSFIHTLIVKIVREFRRCFLIMGEGIYIR